MITAMTSPRRRVLVMTILCGSLTLPILAQGQAAPAPPPAGGAAKPGQAPGQAPLALEDRYLGLKHHASFAISGGFDLDFIGDIINGGLGSIDDRQIAVRQAQPWPEVYVALPKRAQASVGFALFQHDEIVARVSQAHYVSEPLGNAGNFAGTAGNETITVNFSDYRERAWEVGWRHYLIATRTFKQYGNILFGVRTVDPIRATIIASGPENTLGTVRMYGRSKCNTVTLEMGLSVERGHFGLYTEVGLHWQNKLTRDDTDLVPWLLQPINNNGPRVYMPLQFGLVFRL